jgi:hypothetical protein
VTVSLEKTWGKKIERDLDGLKSHGHTPQDVWAVTNRKTGARRRGELERDAPQRWGQASVQATSGRALRASLSTGQPGVGRPRWVKDVARSRGLVDAGWRAVYAMVIDCTLETTWLA